jgi:hypothetical protein
MRAGATIRRAGANHKVDTVAQVGEPPWRPRTVPEIHDSLIVAEVPRAAASDRGVSLSKGEWRRRHEVTSASRLAPWTPRDRPGGLGTVAA